MLKEYTQLNEQLYNYIIDSSLREPKVLQEHREEVNGMRMGAMQSPPDQCQFLGMLLRLINAKHIVEVGTFTGYFTLWMALNIPDDGSIIACDIEEKWSKIGRRYWEKANVDHKINLRIAPAIESMQALLKDNNYNYFDFIFIDADKENYLDYYELALLLIRPGGVIAIDNVFWGGTVVKEGVTSEEVKVIRALNKKVASDPRVTCSMLPIGDGLTLITKK